MTSKASALDVSEGELAVAGVVTLDPAAPSWLPVSIARTVYLLERL